MAKPINDKCLNCALTYKPGLRVTHVHYQPVPSCWETKTCSRKRNYYKHLEEKRKKQRLDHSYIKYSTDRCNLCSLVVGLEAHHIIPQAQGGKDVKNNIMTLCMSCHKMITRYQNACRSIQNRRRDENY